MNDFKQATERLQIAALENHVKASEEALQKAQIERECAEVQLEREKIHRDAVIETVEKEKLDLGIGVNTRGES